MDGWTLHQVRDPVGDCTSHKSREGGVENRSEVDCVTRVHVPWLEVGLSSGYPAKQPRAEASCWHPVMYHDGHAARGVLLQVTSLYACPIRAACCVYKILLRGGQVLTAWWNICFPLSRKELGNIKLGYDLVNQAFNIH